MRMTLMVYGGLLVLVLALGLFLWGRSSGAAALRPRLATAEIAARAARQSVEGRRPRAAAWLTRPARPNRPPP